MKKEVISQNDIDKQILSQKKHLIQNGSFTDVKSIVDKFQLTKIYWTKNVIYSNYENIYNTSKENFCTTNEAGKFHSQNLKNILSLQLSYNDRNRSISLCLSNIFQNSLDKKCFLAIYPNVIFETNKPLTNETQAQQLEYISIYLIVLNKINGDKTIQNGIIKLS
ncbi:hypothetical protein ACFX5K_06115 [Rickettsiales bacterium LUAb2]